MAENSIRISTGAISVEVNDDGECINFTPDVWFVERFYELYGEIENSTKDFNRREAEIDSDARTDENGIPVNIKDRIALIKEVCLFCESKIDSLFGADSCKKALGGTMNPNCYIELLEKLTPFIEKSRNKVMSKHRK